jgi:hypothetical protein
MMIGGVLRKAAEDNAPNPARCGGEFSRNGSDGNARGPIRRKTINTSRDGWKREQFVLAVIAAAPHRANSVNHMLCRKPIAGRDLRLTGHASAEFFTFRTQLGTGCAMDCTINTAAAEQCAVRRVDDCIERKRRYVGYADFEPGGADFSGKERWVFRHFLSISRPLRSRLRP